MPPTSFLNIFAMPVFARNVRLLRNVLGIQPNAEAYFVTLTETVPYLHEQNERGVGGPDPIILVHPRTGASNHLNRHGYYRLQTSGCSFQRQDEKGPCAGNADIRTYFFFLDSDEFARAGSGARLPSALKIHLTVGNRYFTNLTTASGQPVLLMVG